MRKDCSTCKHDYEDDCYPIRPPCNDCVNANPAPTNWEPADYYKPDTNADRIRAMTDEELARFLVDISNDCTSRCECCAYTRRCTDKCIGGVRDWLRQPVKED